MLLNRLCGLFCEEPQNWGDQPIEIFVEHTCTSMGIRLMNISGALASDKVTNVKVCNQVH